MATWTQDDIDSLKIAIASGVLIVSYDGPPKRMITYQSLNSMRELLASMIADVAAQNRSATYRLATTKKGFGL